MADILIVDDQPANREVLAALLGYRAHHLLEASDGAEALAITRAQHPDLVITDVLMPIMDGYEFVKQLRVDPSISHTPVIYYTAHYLEQEARALAAKSGVIHILTKPFEPEQALRMVDAALGLAAGAPPIAPQPPQPEEFDREHLNLVTNKLSQKAAELRLANLRFQALIELGRELNTESDPATLVLSYCHATREIVGAGLSLILLGGPGDLDRPVFTSGFNVHTAASRLMDCFKGCGIFRDIEHQGMPRRISTLDGALINLAGATAEIEIGSLLASPIASPERLYGWLYAFNKLGNPAFSELEEQLATMLAGQLAVAYEKARLYEEAKREVAERRRAEETVRQRENQYRMLIEQASDGIAIFDAQGHCIEANPVLCRMLDYDRESLMEKKMASLVPQEDATLGPVTRHERRLARKDGKSVLAEIGASVLQDGRVQLIVRDISERKALEEQRQQAQKALAAHELAEARAVLVEELERRNRELEAFSYSVSHDLRAPLRRINGFSAALLEDYAAALDAHGRDCLERVKSGAQRMGEIIDDLLKLARVGRANLKHEPVNLSAIALAIAADFQTAARERSVRVLIADGVMVEADGRLLRVVLENLLGNAWKFTSGVAEPVIEFGVAQSNGVPSYFVRDNGAGFDMAHVEKLFTPFQRLHPEARFPGTGIGLATVQKIVDRHGGRVWAKGAVEKGATFFWTLPPGGSARLL